MIIREKYTSSVIGAGNLAYSLIPNLQKNNIIVKNIISRDLKKANEFADKFNINANLLESGMKLDAHIVFLAVSDDSIQKAAAFLNLDDSQILLHTSGSTQISVLKNHAQHFGVMYPLQTFTKGHILDFSCIPLFVEASDAEALNIVKDISGLLSSNVSILSGKQRKQLHMTAVFVSNFTNHMYNIGAYLMDKERLDFSLLYPLIEETTQKIKHMSPKEAQTGPAVRRNQTIIEEHKKMLRTDYGLADLYEAISNSIHDFN